MTDQQDGRLPAKERQHIWKYIHINSNKDMAIPTLKQHQYMIWNDKLPTMCTEAHGICLIYVNKKMFLQKCFESWNIHSELIFKKILFTNLIYSILLSSHPCELLMKTWSCTLLQWTLWLSFRICSYLFHPVLSSMSNFDPLVYIYNYRYIINLTSARPHDTKRRWHMSSAYELQAHSIWYFNLIFLLQSSLLCPTLIISWPYIQNQPHKC